MKKFLLLAAVAAMLGTGAAQAEITYTLTKDFETTNVPAGTDVRQGVWSNGYFYLQDNGAKQLNVYDKTGTLVKTYENTGGCGVAVDEAGNILVTTIAKVGDNFRNDTVQFKAISADGTKIKDFTVSTIPAGRSDCLGKISGNVFGTATMLMSLANQTRPYAICWIDGEIDATSSQLVVTTGDALSGFGSQGYGQFAYSDADENEHFLFETNRNGYCYDLTVTYNATGVPEATSKKIPTTKATNAGGEIFKLGNDLYMVSPTKNAVSNYTNNFQIEKIESDYSATTVVASSEVNTVATNNNSGKGNWLYPVVEDANTVKIYQYYPGGAYGISLFAGYTLKVVDPSTGVSDVNASKTVAGVHYVNLAGQVSATPFDGMNIKVTNYTDGSQKATKVIK